MSVTEYTADQVAAHSTEDDCWIIYRNEVFALPVEFVTSTHPGGNVIAEVAGKDGTNLFEDGPHGDAARETLQQFKIGRLKPPQS